MLIFVMRTLQPEKDGNRDRFSVTLLYSRNRLSYFGMHIHNVGSYIHEVPGVHFWRAS